LDQRDITVLDGVEQPIGDIPRIGAGHPVSFLDLKIC
jgi:hypothetical protein